MGKYLVFWALRTSVLTVNLKAIHLKGLQESEHSIGLNYTNTHVWLLVCQGGQKNQPLIKPFGIKTVMAKMLGGAKT